MSNPLKNGYFTLKYERYIKKSKKLSIKISRELRHVGGYWFTAKELMKLPYDYIKKNRSPYYGGIIDDDMQNVPVPVSWITLAGFACFAIVINKKR